MNDNNTNFFKLELAKLLREKLFIIFLTLCLCLNICLCFVDNYTRDAFNRLSAEDFSQNGEKIYHELDGASLGTAYYNQRYIHSSILNQKIKEKYDHLQNAITILNNTNADRSFYAGEMTPVVHKVLFEFQLKALLIECTMFLSLLCLKTFSLERQNETSAVIYSSKRGRKIVKDKIIANGMIGFLYCFILFLSSLTVFFCNWDFHNIWNMNISSSFNYISEPNDPIYMKPFITWTSMTIKEYFIYSLLLMGAFLIAWWLIANTIALFINNDLLCGLLIAAILVCPYFGVMLFPGLQLSIPFYLSTLTLSTVIYDSHMWFTDLGHYSLVAYQEVGIVLIHLLIAMLFIGFATYYFRNRKELT